MGLPNSQLTIICSAKYQLTAIFLVNSQLTTNFVSYFLFYSEYFSIITRILLPSASKSLLGVGHAKVKV